MLNVKKIIRRVSRPIGLEVRSFDPDLTLDTWLWSFFANQNIDCVLDVGAHYGEYAQLLRSSNYNKRIISFEPVAQNFELLQKICAYDRRWEAYPYALGSERKQLEINVASSTNYSSFLNPSEYGTENHMGIHMQGRETVQVHRLDAIFDLISAENPNPQIYLKMDTQGWDMEVLRGAKNCLKHIVAIQLELSIQPLYDHMPDWLTVIRELETLGFAVSAMFPVVRDEQLRLSEIDCIAVRTTNTVTKKPALLA